MNVKDNIEGISGVIIVSNFDRACGFYTKVFGRAPDTQPMSGLAEWHVRNSGVQVLAAEVLVGPKKVAAGQSFVTIFVTDLDELVRAIANRGLAIGPKQPGDAAGIAQLVDPDGNTLTFAQRSTGTQA